MIQSVEPYQSELGVPELLSLVQKALGSSVEEHWPLAGGEVNQPRGMRLASGQEIVVRISPAQKGWDGFEQECWAYDACRKAGIPVPQVLYLDTKKEFFPESCIILSMLSGLNGSKLSLSSEEKASVCRDLGRQLRQMHEISIPKFGQLKKAGGNLEGVHQSLLAFCRYELTESWWPSKALRDNLVADHQLELVLQFIEKHRRRFEAQTGSLVHGDLYLDNVLVDPRSHKITGIVDFENVESHDPLMDLRYFLYPPPEETSSPFEALCEGYGRSPVLDEAETVKLLVFRYISIASDLVYYRSRGLKSGVMAGEEQLRQLLCAVEQDISKSLGAR